MEAWVSEHKLILLYCEVRAPQKDTDAILLSFARHYAGDGLRATVSVCLGGVCKIPGLPGVALINDLAITDKRHGLAGLRRRC